jgi:type II secretory pathway pseudopilin PulG
MRRRHAFTIIELLVSLALILFIMVILTEAFSAGMETFRELKAIGDMQERLRSTTTQLRRDLAADHFEGGRRLSDPTFWVDGYPAIGFFSFWGGASIQEGTDPDLQFPAPPFPGFVVSPVRAPAWSPAQPINHVLSFSVKLRGNGRDNLFSASVPAGSSLFSTDTTFYGYTADAQFQDTPATYNSQWAEVTYFLVPNGTTAGTGTPLYTLYRSQLAAVPDNRYLLPTPVPPNQPIQSNQFATASGNYYEMSCFQNGQYLYFNTPGDLTIPGRRAFGARGMFDPNNPSQWGAQLLLSDVVSVDVRALPLSLPPNNSPGLQPYFYDLSVSNSLFNDPQVNQAWAGSPPINPAWAYPNTNPPTGVIFDTADPRVYNSQYNGPTPGYVIKALQISIRIWELKTQQTRQVTIIQDM